MVSVTIQPDADIASGSCGWPTHPSHIFIVLHIVRYVKSLILIGLAQLALEKRPALSTYDDNIWYCARYFLYRFQPVTSHGMLGLHCGPYSAWE